MYSLCVACATMLQTRGTRSHAEAGQHVFSAALHSSCGRDARPDDSVMAGDILLCGPDRWGIHHVVLCRGPISLAEPEVVEKLEEAPFDKDDLEFVACATIESSRLLRGLEYSWYPAWSYFARKRSSGELMLVGDIADGTNTIAICDTPVPVKLLLHPLRPSFGGPPFDAKAFMAAVSLCSESSRRWSKATALFAIAARRSSLDPGDYTDPAARAGLLHDVKRRWSNKPICSSVAIIVWQRYFEIVSGPSPQGLDQAAQCILRWMPVLSDRTAPSALLKALSACGWVLRTNIGSV